MELGGLKYKDVESFRKFTSQYGLQWLLDNSAEPGKYTFWVNASKKLYELDEDNEITNKEIKDRCLEYLSENSIVGGVEWRSLVQGDQYLVRHLGDHNLSLCDDLMIFTFANIFKQPVRIFEANKKVISVKPVDSDEDKEPILIGKITSDHYTVLNVEDSSKLPNPESDQILELDPENLQNTTINISEIKRIIDEKKESGPIPSVGDPLLEIHDEIPVYDIGVIEPPEDEDRTEGKLMKILTKVFKFLSYIIFFVLVFFGSVISKTCILILANSAQPRTVGTSSPLKDSKGQMDYLRAWSYFFILFCLLFSETLTILYSVYRIILKKSENGNFSTYFWGSLWETLSSLGEAALFLIVLPRLDSTLAILAFSLTGFVPSILNVYAKWVSLRGVSKSHFKSSMKMRTTKKIEFVSALLAPILFLVGIFCFVCISMQVFPVDVVTSSYKEDTNLRTTVLTIVSLILMSLRYWENFVTCNWNFNFCGFKFEIETIKLHENLDMCRFKFSLLSSIIKCGIFVGFTYLTLDVIEINSFLTPPTSGSKGLNNALFRNIKRSPLPYSDIMYKLIMVFITQSFCSLASFFFGRIACMTLVQLHSYSLPLVLVTPVLSIFSAVLTVYKSEWQGTLWTFIKLDGTGKKVPFIDLYIDWITLLDGDNKLVMSLVVIVGLLTIHLAIIISSFYIWSQTQQKIEKTELLFVKALYGGPIIDQSLILNRRQHQEQYYKLEKKNEDENQMKKRRYTKTNNKKNIPHIFLCTTMWHETDQEMTQMLTSLMRMDKDESKRRSMKNDVDKYSFHIHILFDDAFETEKGTKNRVPNKYVYQLCRLVPFAANKVEKGKGYELPLPVIYSTPYGARLEFIMPNNNMMFVHLKDKNKIRHRKRWSQCMYMYYILGYLHMTKKFKKIEDIFILALDGDVDFQPNSVLTLVDRMLRNDSVGAACGRIHPVGGGPVVWFQKFEYAVGHWLQKTAEHVLGCVLCSPGCFSMFRGKALMDTNVVKTYTTKATEALHYVQWDQGEDRWLCTLLLKQGWRIEYSAASDSFTFAPEDFKEFYNQRRRWGPSTMANVFDILSDSSITVKNNDYVSWGYVTYQGSLLISSVLGPATVVMMVQGAFSYIFRWDATVSLLVALIPVIIYIFLCYTTSQDTQVAVAGILTIVYALVMMAVLVGVVGAMASTTILDPNNLFYAVMAGLYFFTAVLHPQEISCLFHAPLYYLCVPSAFIFLMVYSLNNMDNVSWGTRENKKPGDMVEQVEQKPQSFTERIQEKLKMNATGSSKESESGYTCGLGNFCQCAVCITPQPHYYVPVANQEPGMIQPQRRRTTAIYRKPTMSKAQMIDDFSKAKAVAMGQDADRIKKRMSRTMTVRDIKDIGGDASNLTTGKLRRISRQTRTSTFHRDNEDALKRAQEEAEYLHNNLDNESTRSGEYQSDYSDSEFEGINEIQKIEEENESLSWIFNGEMENCQIDYIEEEERSFWRYIIDQYLYPLEEDAEEKKRIQEDLKALRNKVTGAYYFANALWLVLNFALQLAISDVAISFVLDGSQITLNPVSFLFLLFFVVVLIVQFTCMLAHRWSTALHVLAKTTLSSGVELGVVNTISTQQRKEAEEEFKRKKMRKASFGEIPDSQRVEEVPEDNIQFRDGYNTGKGHLNEAFEDDTDSGHNSFAHQSSNSTTASIHLPSQQNLTFRKGSLRNFYMDEPDEFPEPRLNRKSAAIQPQMFELDEENKVVKNQPQVKFATTGDGTSGNLILLEDQAEQTEL